MYQFEGEKNFITRSVMLLMIIPFTLGFLFSFFLLGISSDISFIPWNYYYPGEKAIFPFNYIFPIFGDGTAGSVLIMGFLLSFYIGVRLFDPTFRDSSKLILLWYKKRKNDVVDETTMNNISLRIYVQFITECIAAFMCIIAGFSLSGAIINDGLPSVEITTKFVVFSIITLIPFLLLTIRRTIFINKTLKLNKVL